MAHTYKDKSPWKSDKQPKIAKKQRKNNINQNLTRNVHMFLEQEEELEDDEDFDVFTSDDTADYPGDLDSEE